MDTLLTKDLETIELESDRAVLIDVICTAMKEIADKEILGDIDLESYTYGSQRVMINRTFDQTSAPQIADIMLRLTVIDSLYSTNAKYAYFAIEQMARTIAGLGNDKEIARYFIKFAKNPSCDLHGLFSNRYGIRKNLKTATKQISLMSKYANFVVAKQGGDTEFYLGFPIYDSLVVKVAPKLCRALGIKCNGDKVDTKMIGNNIVEYIGVLNEIRKTLFGDKLTLGGVQQYDLLDAFLWRMGKLESGNLSLLLTHEEYYVLVKNLGMQGDEEEYFNKRLKEKLLKAQTPFNIFGFSSDRAEYLSKLLTIYKALV